MTMKHFGTSVPALERLRDAIRLGQAAKAENALAGAKSGGDTAVERGLLALLVFAQPAAITSKPASSHGAIRAKLLEAILSNRRRDPLRALALLAEGRQLADAQSHAKLTIDILFEQAKVYTWLGNEPQAAEHLTEALALCHGAALSSLRFIALSRLASLHAEVDRDEAARRYIKLADDCAKGLGDSIYFAQHQILKASIDPYSSASRAWLARHMAGLPPYLQFRARLIAVGDALAGQDALKAEKAIAAITVSSGSFEETLLSVYQSRLDLLLGKPANAVPKLEQAADWFADEDIAARIIEVKLLLAQALVESGKPDKAVQVLDEARNYATQRDLRVQTERIERAVAEHGLALHPVIENARRTGAEAWKDQQAYVLLKKLGSGGQASVYLAHDNARNRRVAYKKLARGDVEALAREVKLANAANVQGIARVIACGRESGGGLYLVQEFVEGQSLRQLITENRASAAHTAALQKTLQSLHKAGITHGDVKPENVIVDDAGRVTLVDFGLAQFGTQKTQGATARYAAPSLAGKFKPATWRDEFALGLIMLECAGVKLPETHETLGDFWRIAPPLSRALAVVSDLHQRAEIRKLLKPI